MALPALLASVSVKSVKILTIKRGLAVGTRLPASGSLQALARQASLQARLSGLSTWSGVLHSLAGANLSSEMVATVLREASFHASNHTPLASAEIAPTAAVAESLQQRVSQIQSNQLLALSSEVITRDEQKMQLPLLDYALPFSDKNTSTVVQSAIQLGLPYAIFCSGASYHYYGLKLLSSMDYFNEFLGRAALLSPLVDARWIAHQIIDNQATLRISPSGDGSCPSLVTWTGWPKGFATGAFSVKSESARSSSKRLLSVKRVRQ
jgi:hypothetical protein